MYTLQSWQISEKDPSNFIIQASTKNGLDEWTPFPIGMSWGCLSNQTTSFVGDHSELVLCAISGNTDASRRGHKNINRHSILKTLQSNGIENVHLQHSDYFQSLASYKFVISPEGNGIDCHRHYEALVAGCIPVIERNPFIEEKYKGCPILWTTDYSEITPMYLLNQYDTMVEKDYDFSRLFTSYYPLDVQREMKENSDHWIQYFKQQTRKSNKLLPFLKI
jgi:hypothetical protein